MLKDLSDFEHEIKLKFNFEINSIRNISSEVVSKKSNDYKKRNYKSTPFSKKSLEKTRKKSDDGEMCSESKKFSFVSLFIPISFEHSTNVNFCKEDVKKPIQISGKELDIIVGLVKRLKTWVVFALRQLFSGGKMTQSLPKVNLDDLYEYKDWFRRFKKLIDCIKSKNYGGALEVLSKCLEHSKNLTVIGSKNKKKSADILSDLFLFCINRIEVIWSLVNENLFRKKMKFWKPNCYSRSVMYPVKTLKQKFKPSMLR